MELVGEIDRIFWKFGIAMSAAFEFVKWVWRTSLQCFALAGSNSRLWISGKRVWLSTNGGVSYVVADRFPERWHDLKMGLGPDPSIDTGGFSERATSSTRFSTISSQTSCKSHGVFVFCLSIFVAMQLFAEQASAQIPNVLSAFKAINEDDAQRFNIARPNSIQLPPGTRIGDYHQQSIQRVPSGGFAVSGSSASSGYLYFTNRSNIITKIVTPRKGSFNHLGGFQIAQGFLAVGYESYEAGEFGTSKILFYDIADLTRPRSLPHLEIDRSSASSTAGAVAMCLDGREWLLLVGNWNCNRLDFYRSDSDNLRAATSSFKLVGQWTKARDGLASTIDDYNWGKYQNINLFRQRDGKIFFIGMHSNISIGQEDWADLYRVDFGRKVAITKVSKKHFHRNGTGPRFRYGSGAYWNSRKGKFEVYACEGNLSGSASSISRCNLWQ